MDYENITETISVPSWKGFLFISLFNGDGGDGYTEEEIEEANVFIMDNNYVSLVEVSDPVDDQMKCTFRISDDKLSNNG